MPAMADTPPSDEDRAYVSISEAPVKTKSAPSRRKSQPANDEKKRQNLARMRILVGEDHVQQTGEERKGPCHQCHDYIRPGQYFVRCDVNSVRSKGNKPCNKLWHLDRGCLIEHYEEDELTLMTSEENKELGDKYTFFDPQEPQWACPVCRDICNESICKQKRNKALGIESEPRPKAAAKSQQKLSLPTAPPSTSASPAPGDLSAHEHTATTPASSAPSPSHEPTVAKKSLADLDTQSVKKARMPKKAVDKKIIIDKKITSVKRKAAKISGDEAPTPAPETPSKSARKRLHTVADPNFEFIQIDYDEDDFSKKLFIREFVVRFGRDVFKIQQTHIKAAENPNKDWSDSFYKSIIVSLLEHIPQDAEFDDDEIVDRVIASLTAIRKMSADKVDLWEELVLLMQGISPFCSVPMLDWESMTFEEVSDKLRMTECLISIMTKSEAFRVALKHSEDKMRKIKLKERDAIKVENANYLDKKKRLKSEELSLDKDDVAAVERVKFQAAVEVAQHTSTLEDIELQHWLQTRRVDYRYAQPLGIDILGNLYQVFTPLFDGEDGWGSWIIVSKGKTVVHPLGYFPHSLEEDPEDTKREWFAIDGSTDLNGLILWIGNKAQRVWFDIQEGQYKTPVKPKKSAGRRFSVYIDNSDKSKPATDPKTIATDESIDELCGKLRHIQRMLVIYERQQITRKMIRL